MADKKEGTKFLHYFGPLIDALRALGGSATPEEATDKVAELCAVPMDLVKLHLARAAEIIGKRTPGEERYDRELIRWLEKGKPIRKAIAKANDKHPREALQIDDASLPDVQNHYEYLLEHERIMRRLKT